MSGPTVRTSKSGQTRYYHHPVTGERAVGVTSVIGMLPKEFLKWWSAKVTAETAVEEIGTLVSMVTSASPDAKSSAVDWLKGAHRRTTGDAATRGTRVHDWTEKIDQLGTMPKRVPADVLPYMRGYLEFREQTEAEILRVETTIWNHDHNYSGTLDRTLLLPESAFANFEEPPPWYEGPTVPIVGDVKTSRSGVFEEVAIQIGAYREATHAMIEGEHGNLTPEVFPYHAEHGLVIHLRPDAWRLVPTNSGPDTFEVFTHLLGVLKWEKQTKKRALLPDLAGRSFDEADVVALADLLEVVK